MFGHSAPFVTICYFLMLTDGDRSVVDDYQGTPVDPPPDSDGLLSGRIDRVAYLVYPLENRDGLHADPGGRLVKHADRFADLGGHDGGLLRLAVYPVGQLGCRDCLAEGCGGLQADPADSVADPTGLVLCLEGPGLHLPLGSRSEQRSDCHS